MVTSYRYDLVAGLKGSFMLVFSKTDEDGEVTRTSTTFDNFRDAKKAKADAEAALYDGLVDDYFS